MIPIKKIEELSQAERKKILERSKLELEDIKVGIQKIIDDVRKFGDKAISDKYAKRFEKIRITKEFLKITQTEIDKAYEKVSPELLEAIKEAVKNIKKFHAAQLPTELKVKIAEGIELHQLVRPIEKVGCYVPGGRAPYPSSVLMTVLPAKVAGVERIVVCTPPQTDGTINPLILVACDIVGADEIYRVGGAQAIAAMAFGTETITKVDKIVGPGNIYVTTAKILVAGYVATDFPAGPSEVLILADDTAKPDWVAIDMLAQAEHDPNAAAVLVTTSEKLANQVKAEVEKQTKTLERAEIIEESLSKNGWILIAKNMGEAVDFTNDYAPEHLEIQTKNAEALVSKIKNAGSIFVGEYAPVPVGDYASGTNHVLPTSGFARAYSGLSVYDFIKQPTVQILDKAGLDKLKKYVIKLAEMEGLKAHAESVRKR
ncbi:MAG: histidinol dehydrogenase [Euryarchaeota archaeon]|nr:histidinol dehydrogenase [Euryarchaeota archaeon]